jgi:hypothetical protein
MTLLTMIGEMKEERERNVEGGRKDEKDKELNCFWIRNKRINDCFIPLSRSLTPVC